MNIAIISGASSGIGYEITKLLDKEGLDELWLIASNIEKLKKSSEAFKTPVKLFALDLSKNNALNELTIQLSEIKPNIKYLVCSAGVGYNGGLVELTSKQISKMVDINVRALTSLTYFALPYIENGGKILEIASGSGFMPQPGFSVYAATKAYVISFSRALRHEIRKRKISVTAVCPGPVETPFFASLENVKDYKRKYAITPEKVAHHALKCAKKRKAISTPTFSMKMVRLASKIFPTSLMMKFYK